MGRRKDTDTGEETSEETPELSEAPAPPEIAVQINPTPIPIVDIDEVEQQIASPSPGGGQRFFFGEIGVLKFDDGTKFHIRKHHQLVTDPAEITNLIEAAKNPAHKIFLED